MDYKFIEADEANAVKKLLRKIRGSNTRHKMVERDNNGTYRDLSIVLYSGCYQTQLLFDIYGQTWMLKTNSWKTNRAIADWDIVQKENGPTYDKLCEDIRDKKLWDVVLEQVRELINFFYENNLTDIETMVWVGAGEIKKINAAKALEELKANIVLDASKIVTVADFVAVVQPFLVGKKMIGEEISKGPLGTFIKDLETKFNVTITASSYKSWQIRIQYNTPDVSFRHINYCIGINRKQNERKNGHYNYVFKKFEDYYRDDARQFANLEKIYESQTTKRNSLQVRKDKLTKRVEEIKIAAKEKGLELRIYNDSFNISDRILKLLENEIITIAELRELREEHVETKRLR